MTRLGDNERRDVEEMLRVVNNKLVTSIQERNRIQAQMSNIIDQFNEEIDQLSAEKKRLENKLDE